MSDGKALRRAVLDRPFDDAPRLIFADWLDEHGKANLAARIRYGVANPEEYFTGAVCVRHPRHLAFPVRFVRGLVGHVRGRLWDLRRSSRSLFSRYPITTVRCQRDGGLWPEAREGGRWMWYDYDLHAHPHADIGMVGMYLADYEGSGGAINRWWAYPNRLAAWRDLEEAIVHMGRVDAGLPALDPRRYYPEPMPPSPPFGHSGSPDEMF